MDEDAVKKVGLQPLRDILHQVEDLYPIKESAFRERSFVSAEDSKDLGTTVIFLSKLGISALLSFGAGADDKDPDSVAVQASPPWRIGLPAKELYGDAAVTEKYESVISEVLAVLHPNHSDENTTLHAEWMRSNSHGNMASRVQSEGLAHEIVELEKKLAAASPKAEDANDVTVNEILLAKVTVELTLSEILQPDVDQRCRRAHTTDQFVDDHRGA